MHLSAGSAGKPCGVSLRHRSKCWGRLGSPVEGAATTCLRAARAAQALGRVGPARRPAATPVCGGCRRPATVCRLSRVGSVGQSADHLPEGPEQPCADAAMGQRRTTRQPCGGTARNISREKGMERLPASETSEGSCTIHAAGDASSPASGGLAATGWASPPAVDATNGADPSADQACAGGAQEPAKLRARGDGCHQAPVPAGAGAASTTARVQPRGRNPRASRTRSSVASATELARSRPWVSTCCRLAGSWRHWP